MPPFLKMHSPAVSWLLTSPIPISNNSAPTSDSKIKLKLRQCVFKYSLELCEVMKIWSIYKNAVQGAKAIFTEFLRTIIRLFQILAQSICSFSFTGNVHFYTKRLTNPCFSRFEYLQMKANYVFNRGSRILNLWENRDEIPNKSYEVSMLNFQQRGSIIEKKQKDNHAY